MAAHAATGTATPTVEETDAAPEVWVDTIITALAMKQGTDEWLTRVVQRANAQGVSWAHIGQLFGVSRAAVYDRFAVGGAGRHRRRQLSRD